MVDLIIRNARIIDGSGAEAYTADVLLDRGIIEGIGKYDAADACKVIDAAGRYLTPGFIDIHRHADFRALGAEFGAAELCQGITTCISGNCGLSAVPCPERQKKALYKYLEPCLGKIPEEGFTRLGDYAKRLSGGSLPLNMGMYAGNGDGAHRSKRF